MVNVLIINIKMSVCVGGGGGVLTCLALISE